MPNTSCMIYMIPPANLQNPNSFNSFRTISKAVEAEEVTAVEESEAEEPEAELVSPLTPRRSHPAQSGETFDGPPSLERSGSEHREGAVTSLALLERARAWEWVKDPPAGDGQVGQIQHRVGRFPSSSLRFQSPANGGTEGGVKTIEGRFPGCSSPNLSISSKQSPSNACLEAKEYSSCQFIQANSFSSLIWSSIFLNSGVFITSAFRCFFDDFFQIPSPCLLVLFCNKWRALLSVEGVPGKWLEVEVPEEGFMLGAVEFHWVIYTGTITKMPYSNQY